MNRYPDPIEVDRLWAIALIRALEERDRGEGGHDPIDIPRFTKAALATLRMRASVRSIVWCDDAAGGAQLAVWDGTAWVKARDGTAI